MLHNCKSCQSSYEITTEDSAYYSELSLPEPTKCPPCRERQRLAWRNEWNLYKRTCSATGKPILSVFRGDVAFPVYQTEEWYSDKWNAASFGRPFDFNRSFFEQYEELFKVVPQISLSVVNNQNSDYINQAGFNKDCYLVFEADYNQGCIYGNSVQKSKDCIDCVKVFSCELCYNDVNCENCYNLKFSDNCVNCSDSWFLESCIGCSNCFGCVNLRNKQYHIWNQPYTQEEYFKKLAEIDLKSRAGLAHLRTSFDQWSLQFPRKYLHGIQNDNSTGDYLSNTQNCQDCFDVRDSQDCKWVSTSRKMKKVYDVTVFGADAGAEFCSNCHEVGEGVRNVHFSDQVWVGSYDIFYSKLCMNGAHHLFGCIGLRHASYCILNQQYSKEEYEALVPRIIEHMKKTGEWGEFFPARMSPFPYTDTLGQVYMPMTKEEALAKGFNWIDPEVKMGTPQPSTLPADISGVADSIVNEILTCESCTKPYKIIKQELDFYRKQGLPVPTSCHECRNKVRRARRNPRTLWDRNCGKCAVALRTSYAPERPEIVYCENCYLGAVV